MANLISSTTTTKIKVAGTLSVTGLSYIPSEAKIFVEILTVKGVDQTGKQVDLKVISSNSLPQVGDSQGNITGKVVGGKLNIIPLWFHQNNIQNISFFPSILLFNIIFSLILFNFFNIWGKYEEKPQIFLEDCGRW